MTYDDRQVDKKKFKDARGRFIVQGLFLEDSYNTDLAVYTYADEEKEYKGNLYQSLKQLYLKHNDPVEYDFANTHLASWSHWQRLCRNKLVGAEVEKWREELALKLTSEGIAGLINLALNKDSYQAAKYLADRGWDTKEKGRPSNEEIEGHIKNAVAKDAMYNDDLILLHQHRGK